MIHFAWHAQYLVKWSSWSVTFRGMRGQHFVTFWEIAGAPNVVFNFSIQNACPRWGR